MNEVLNNLTESKIKLLIDSVNSQISIVANDLETLSFQYKEKELKQRELIDLLNDLKTTFESNTYDTDNNKVASVEDLKKLNSEISLNQPQRVRRVFGKSWWDKVKDALNSRNRLFYANELIQILTKTEKEENPEDYNFDNSRKNVFATLTTNNRKGLLKRIRVGKDYKYGLANWYHEDGTLKEEYRMNG